MRIHYRALCPHDESERWAELTALRGEFWIKLAQGERERALSLLSLKAPGLSCEGCDQEVSVLYDRVSLRPLAEWFVQGAGGSQRARVGRAEQDFAEALRRAFAETNVDLASSRVRVGFSRGHLLELVVQVPLEVPGDAEALQVAAEIFLEQHLGDDVLDQWIGQISVDRIARTRGLLMARDSATSSTTEPLGRVRELVRIGIEGVRQTLPRSLIEPARSAEESDWVALDIPESEAGLQADRVFASTRFPEALKACLEELPFYSGRFTLGPEIFCYVRIPGGAMDPGERAQRRARLEAFFLERERRASLLLGGTGFGRHDDYVDFWVLPEPSILEALLSELTDLIGAVELGFYDSHLEEEGVLQD